ncbi:MAG: DUF4421 family protein [Tunicatimonas sp.]
MTNPTAIDEARKEMGFTKGHWAGRPRTRRMIRAGGRLGLGLALLLQVSLAAGQSIDSSYVQKFPQSLNLRLIYALRGGDLRVRHPQQEGQLLYLPRYHPRVGVGGFLWNIGFNLLLPLPLPRLAQDQRISRFDFQTSVFATRWLVDGIFQRYRGFTLRRAGVPPSLEMDEFRPELVTKKMSVAITYLPGGDRISLRSPYNQGVRQRKSAGSLLLSGSGTYLTVRDPGAVVPAIGLPRELALERVRVYALSSKVGYAANLIYRSWFVHLLAMTGLDWQQTYYVQGETQSAFAVEPTYDLRSGLGYDTGRWYAGVYGTLDYNQYQAGDWQFQATSGQLRFFFGIRLAEPRWLQRLKPKFLEDWQNSPSIPLPPIFG